MRLQNWERNEDGKIAAVVQPASGSVGSALRYRGSVEPRREASAPELGGSASVLAENCSALQNWLLNNKVHLQNGWRQLLLLHSLAVTSTIYMLDMKRLLLRKTEDANAVASVLKCPTKSNSI